MYDEAAACTALSRDSVSGSQAEQEESLTQPHSCVERSQNTVQSCPAPLPRQAVFCEPWNLPISFLAFKHKRQWERFKISFFFLLIEIKFT